ncbi:CHC2 zinc finger domain-containing protein [Candidatus Pacearchaeota archaeon]|nr:CHC2 zinc finger domain-containing protein [Candidatus Pacearchaeota archaeon]
MFAHIKSANRKVRTIQILRGYGFKIEKNYQRPTWSNNITCPLPGHKGAKERTPSFGYCFVSDHWFCFGCHKSGRAVEFISLYERVSRTLVAEKILAQYGDDADFEEDNDYIDDISPILLEGSKHLQNLIQKHKDNPKKLKEINRYVWWLDFYLMAKAPGNHIKPEDLKRRIDRVKEVL